MRILVILLVLSISTMAYAYPNRTIRGVDGVTLNIRSDGSINTGLIDAGGDEALIQADGDLNVAVKTGSSLVAGRTWYNDGVDLKVAQVLFTDTAVKQVSLIAHATNNHHIYVGPSTVTSTNGCLIASTNYLVLDVDNLTDIYIIGEHNDDAVDWVAIVE